jgi:hypothetical protein
MDTTLGSAVAAMGARRFLSLVRAAAQQSDAHCFPFATLSI